MQVSFFSSATLRPEGQSNEIVATRLIAAALAALAIGAGIWMRDWKVGLGLGAVPIVLVSAGFCMRPPASRQSSFGSVAVSRSGSQGGGSAQGRAERIARGESRPTTGHNPSAEGVTGDEPTTQHSMLLTRQTVQDGELARPLVVGTTQITVVGGDITKQRVDAIVNAANSKLAGGSGVDAAIKGAAGDAPYVECATSYSQGCQVGDAVVTGSGNLQGTMGVKMIVHAVAPVWGTPQCDGLLGSAYMQALTRAHDRGATSVAVPILGSKAFLTPAREASIIAIESMVRYVQRHPGQFTEVRIMLYEESVADAFLKAFEAKRSELATQ